MIDAKDLRIGNWIWCNLGGSCEQVEADDFEMIADDFGGFEGIPLTPEILEKCGFENDYGQIEMYSCGKIWMHFDGESLSANFGHIEQLDVYVKFLHQLQNLFFALIGEELKINLNVEAVKG